MWEQFKQILIYKSLCVYQCSVAKNNQEQVIFSLAPPLPWLHFPISTAQTVSSKGLYFTFPFFYFNLLYLSFQRCSRTMRKQLDKNLSFHKLVGYMIALMTGECLRETHISAKTVIGIKICFFFFF